MSFKIRKLRSKRTSFFSLVSELIRQFKRMNKKFGNLGDKFGKLEDKFGNLERSLDQKLLAFKLPYLKNNQYYLDEDDLLILFFFYVISLFYFRFSKHIQ
jgi:hypothetical protein